MVSPSSWCRDHWQTLGIARDADVEAVKKAFRQLALVHHPDRVSSANEAGQKAAAKKFKAISEAYEVLSDDRQRAAYKASTSYSSAASYSSPGTSHHPGSYYTSSSAYQNVNADYARSYYQPGRRSRIGLWQHLYRMMGTKSMRRVEVLALAGGTVATIIAVSNFESIWKYRNRGKSFEETQLRREELKAASLAASGSAQARHYAAAGCGPRGSKPYVGMTEGASQAELASMPLADLLAREEQQAASKGKMQEYVDRAVVVAKGPRRPGEFGGHVRSAPPSDRVQ